MGLVNYGGRWAVDKIDGSNVVTVPQPNNLQRPTDSTLRRIAVEGSKASGQTMRGTRACGANLARIVVDEEQAETADEVWPSGTSGRGLGGVARIGTGAWSERH